MAITNKNLIKQIEKKYNVSLNFYYMDSYGLYCDIIKNNNKDTLNVYDSDNTQYMRKELLRDFLTNIIYQYLE